MAERAAWFRRFATQFADVGLSLGFTQTEIDQILADNEVVQFLAGALVSLNAYARAVTAFQRRILLGKIDNKTSVFPAAPVLNVPAMTPTGIFARLEMTVRRLRIQPGYSPSIGTMLGIVPRNPSRAVATDLVPKLKVTPLEAPYSFSVSTTRLHYSMFVVEYRRALSDEWTIGGSFTMSPATVRVEPQNPGTAELIYVRLRMIKNNQPVGNYSPMQTVALTP